MAFHAVFECGCCGFGLTAYEIGVEKGYIFERVQDTELMEVVR